ncbi:MAG: protein translocase subunit SecF [Synergistaceae bacterium]|nr:protein translocase subunit SecF [Synergistaceae bacterium]
MAFTKKRTWNIDFMRLRRGALILSLVAVLASLGLLATKGLNLGIDFTGGSLIQVEFPEAVAVEEVRTALESVGKGGSQIQAYSDVGVIVRLQEDDGEDSEASRRASLGALKEAFPKMDVLRLEKVGPIVGQQLRQEALLGVLLALVGILVYITVRFRFRFAVASVLALIHDSILVLGLFSLTGREISLPFIAAILTIVGYSLNDTIVVLDRVRENWKDAKRLGIVSLLNLSINQTLSRTINTSLTTFLPVLALFLWGGPVLANFSFAFLAGIVVGTYSSIFVSGAVLAEWHLKSPRLS